MSLKFPSIAHPLWCYNPNCQQTQWLFGQRRWSLHGEEAREAQAPGITCNLQSPGRLVFTCTLHGIESSAVDSSPSSDTHHWLNVSATKDNVISCHHFSNEANVHSRWWKCDLSKCYETNDYLAVFTLYHGFHKYLCVKYLQNRFNTLPAKERMLSHAYLLCVPSNNSNNNWGQLFF